MASTDPIIESSYYFLLLFWLEGVMLRSCYQRCGMTQTCRSPTVSPSYQTNSSEKNKWDKRETHVPLQSPSADCNSLSLCVTDMYKSAFFFKWWIIEGRDRLTRNAKKEKKKKRHEKETQKWKERGKVCKKKNSETWKEIKKISPVSFHPIGKQFSKLWRFWVDPWRR